jgi:hypothetical protein
LGAVTPVTFPVNANNNTGDGLGGESAVVQPKLETLVQDYRNSEIAKGIEGEMKALQDDVARGSSNGNNGNGNGGAAAVSNEPVDAVLETSLLRGRKRASWGTQFRILSGRAFKNLYRDPALLAAHYLSAIGLARESSSFLFCPCVVCWGVES